jgi:uncharacterized protein
VAPCATGINHSVATEPPLGYPNPLPLQAVMTHLAEACAEDVHEFWVDELSLLDSDLIDATQIHGPRRLTDIYLLALAVERQGRFITFDGKIPLAAVRKAKPENLVVL